jgi:hypothetical protein
MDPAIIHALLTGVDLIFTRLEQGREGLSEAEIESRNEIRRQLVRVANEMPKTSDPNES